MESNFKTKEELFKHLKENKTLLEHQKKSTIKQADAFSHCSLVYVKDSTSNKSEVDLSSSDAIQIKAVINSTLLLDSHEDVHINGIWNKSLKEQKTMYLIKEHNFSFDNVISDDVKAYAKLYSWKELGFDYEGKTEALVFESTIRKNETDMFMKYAQSKVHNHSVGMQYVKIHLAINSDESEYKEEKEIWDKYILQIANKEAAIDKGYFWAVTEAKLIEGSAVLRGSNFATPTLEVSQAKNEPFNDTQSNEPNESLVKEPMSMFARIGKTIIN